MVENNVKENLIDDEEELYVNLNDSGGSQRVGGAQGSRRRI